MTPRCIAITLALILALTSPTDAFAPLKKNHHAHAHAYSQVARSSSVEMSAFWRHWIPETDPLAVQDPSMLTSSSSLEEGDSPNEILEKARMMFMGSFLVAALMLVMLVPQASLAVSGGGLDYAGTDISGQDFSNSNDYKGKDFTQVIAKGSNFANSNLQGCRFYKAYLVNTDFSGADIRGVSLEDTSMDGASLKNTIAMGSYFSKSIIDVASVENADFTDAQFPLKTIPLLCDREDLKGTNPVTGVDTRESAMCP